MHSGNNGTSHRCHGATVSQMESPSGPVPFIVVGVDGSASSVTALRYAAAEARLRAAELHAVGAYVYSDSGQEAERATRRVNEAVDAALTNDVRLRREEVLVQVHEGAVPEVLHRASEGALLLVVGADARGILGRLVEGSVLPAMTHHVHVPTVIVPSDWQA